jgi:hypothetical protein
MRTCARSHSVFSLRILTGTLQYCKNRSDQLIRC